MTDPQKIKFSYTDEYSDENLLTASFTDFEDAETDDDFSNFDEDDILYGSFDADDEDIDEDSSTEQFEDSDI